MRKIEKMIVAADGEGQTGSNVSDAIAALRNSLTGGEVVVTPEGGVVDNALGGTNSNGDTGAHDGAVRATEPHPTSTAPQPVPHQPNSTQAAAKPWMAVPKATVAADTSVADAIANMRNNLANGEVRVNPDGTVFNPGTRATQSSIANGDQFKPVPKATVAARQWYEKNPDLQIAEIAAMQDTKPDATWGYLPNGKMYWQVNLRPVNAKGEARSWILLGVYDDDHPQQRWGGSVKYYPVKPNYDEMMELVERSSVTPKRIPHLLRDNSGQIYMCTQDRTRIKAGRHAGEVVTTAATGLRFAMRWINVFELGLIDQKTWTMFQHEGEI